ncbi:MAG: DUF308 domain-containing protein [Mogibacterium sp.]|nr:DUF308 domain-containing protein [Mogibacterium sp.]
MRLLMQITSILMIASGIFCVANSSAAFLSVAFIIGMVFILLGASELLISRRGDFDTFEAGVGIVKDGVIMGILGIVMVAGQITDDLTAQTVFALLMTIEGVISFKSDWLDIMNYSGERRIGISLNLLMIVLGVYMFFNTSAFHLPAMLLIGICTIVLGLRRFMQSFAIEYDRPSFITGNEEKLREAEEDEKRALAKAKEGIREQKAAQRRIAKIKEDIAAEQDVMMSAAITRQEREAELEMDE